MVQHDPQYTTQQRIAFLSKISVFSALSPDALQGMAMLLTERQTRAQEPVIKKGEIGNEMFILVEGDVRIHDGNHVLARLKAGDFFGEFALIDSTQRSASVTTEKPCFLLLWNQTDFFHFSKTYPEMLLGILQTQVKRMRDMNELEDKLSKSYVNISKMKQELEVQHQAVQEQKQQLIEQHKELIELNEFKRKTTSILIHGLKNPMTSALTMADMIENLSIKNTEVIEYSQILKQSLLRMDEVLNQLIVTNEKKEL